MYLFSPGYIHFVSCNSQVGCLDPLGHVVVLAAPAPVLVGEPVELLQVGGAQRGHAPEYFCKHRKNILDNLKIFVAV